MLAVAIALLVQVEEQVLARPAAVCVQELAGVHAVDPAQSDSMSSPHILQRLYSRPDCHCSEMQEVQTQQ